MRHGLTILFLVILGVFNPAKAGVEQPDILALNAHLDDALTKKYRDRISTRIPPELFNVAAQVILVSAKDAKPKTTEEISANINKDLPADITLGVLTAMQPVGLVEALRDRVKIEKVEIMVGLSSKLGRGYRQTFATWLNTTIRREFGELGSATVTDLPNVPREKDDPLNPTDSPKTFELKMEPKAIEVNMPKSLEMNMNEPKTPRPLHWEERFGNFQNLVGLLIAGLFMALTFLAGKFILSRDVKEQATTALKIQELRNETVPVSSVSAPNDLKERPAAEIAPVESGLSRHVVYEVYREKQRKVAFLALSCQEKVEGMIDLWLDEGEVGRHKLAAIMDSVLTHIGVTQLTNAKSDKDELNFSWSMPDKVKNDKSVSFAFKSFGVLSLEVRSDILEQAYWDVLSAKAFGEHMVKQRFSNLASLPTPMIQKVLNAQDKKARSLTVLHLPSDKLSQIANGLTLDEKRAMLDQAFENPKLSDIELDVVDQSLTFLIRRETTKGDDVLEVPTLVPNLLAALKPFEEVLLVRELLERRPDAGGFLKMNYASIAFIGDWPKDKLKALLSRARAPEVLALLQAMPELTEIVLEVVAARTRAMVKEDIGKKVVSNEEMDTGLQTIRARLQAMSQNGEIDIRSLYKKDPGPSISVAA